MVKIQECPSIEKEKREILRESKGDFMENKEPLVQILPDVCVDHDREKYHVEIELPGVKKEDISLEMGETSFCISAPKGDIEYAACYTLAHGVDTTKITAKFDNGMLTILAPFKNPIAATKISIE